MTRQRVAIALGIVAVLAVLGTVAVAISTYGGADDPTDPATATSDPLVVHDPASGASFEVPADGWTVRDAQTRIYYDDAAGDPVAVVRGPAVFRDGYCAARPRGSTRAFAGFTQQPFEDWQGGLTRGQSFTSTGVDRGPVRLADGSRATLSRVSLFLHADHDPCTAGAVELAMVEAGDVRVVLVRDDVEPGTLLRQAVEPILTSLVLRD